MVNRLFELEQSLSKFSVRGKAKQIPAEQRPYQSQAFTSRLAYGKTVELTRGFFKDPANFLRVKPVFLETQDVQSIMPREPMGDPQQLTALAYKYPYTKKSNLQVDINNEREKNFFIPFTGDFRTLTLTPSNNEGGTGIRFLPYLDNEITYCEIDLPARWFFTGPLTGCHIYIGYKKFGSSTETDFTMPIVFHVNDNSSSHLTMRDNMLRKERKLAEAFRGDDRLRGIDIYHQLVRTDYRADGESLMTEAFVFGRRSTANDQWDFYFHRPILDLSNKEVRPAPEGSMVKIERRKNPMQL